MAFYVRKRIKIAPGLALNVSKSGLGLSAGPRGFKLSAGPRGVQLNAGRGGLYYRQSLNGALRGGQPQGAPRLSRSARTMQPTVTRSAEQAWTRRVNAATLLYFCFWLPGVLANWQLRRLVRQARKAGLTLPHSGLIRFQFWAFTVLPACVLALVILSAH